MLIYLRVLEKKVGFFVTEDIPNSVVIVFVISFEVLIKIWKHEHKYEQGSINMKMYKMEYFFSTALYELYFNSIFPKSFPY